MEKTCPTCSQSFTTPYPQKRFCSVSCRGRTYFAGVRPCEICGLEYRPVHKEQRFCGKSCARRDRGSGRPERGHAWQGGRYTTKGGYVNVWVGKGHPGALSNGYMPEHRHVMAESLGRHLLRTESVHHINGDRADNRLENLQLRNSQWHGPGQAMVCLDCGSHNVAHVPIKEGPRGVHTFR